MPRCKMLGLTLLTLIVLACLSAGASLAAETTAVQAAPPAPSSPSFASCDGSLRLDNLVVQGEICPATQPEPELMAKPPRLGYCSCGCGATCTSDADCDGGVCIHVITCC